MGCTETPFEDACVHLMTGCFTAHISSEAVLLQWFPEAGCSKWYGMTVSSFTRDEEASSLDQMLIYNVHYHGNQHASVSNNDVQGIPSCLEFLSPSAREFSLIASNCC